MDLFRGFSFRNINCELINLRSFTFNDEDITPMDTNNTTQVDIQGPITRARARQLNLQVISFLRNYSCAFTSSMLPNDLIVLSNEGEDHQGRGKGLGARRTSENIRIKMKAQTGSTSFQFRTPGTARTKTDAQVAYGVIFGCSLYGWKDNFKKLQMEPVSGPNSSGVDGNRLYKLTSRICSGAAPLFWPDRSCIQLESIRDAS
jgi:hypothetical protein